MGELTHESLVEYLIEEAYEVVDSIEAGAAGTDTTNSAASWVTCCSK
jgi:NTP pyrophosphatase (non-canonical NTP hydrolase)